MKVKWQKFLSLVWRFPLSPLVLYVGLFLLLLNLSVWLSAVLFPKLNSGYEQFPGPWQSGIEAACALAACWLIFHFLERRPLKGSGFDLAWPACALELILGFVLGFALVALMVGALILLRHYSVIRFDSAFDLTVPMVVFFFAAVTEEIVFRAFTFLVLERRMGTKWALIASCIIFGLAHLINTVPGALFSQKIYGCLCLVLEAGLLLNAAFLVRRTIWLPLGLHWAWNLFEGPIFGMTVSGSPLNQPLIKAGLYGQFWDTGGPFGPEASLCGLIVGTAGGIAMLTYAMYKGRWQAP